ncbi:CpsD/CapB family tyrosine-protein kinase [Sphingobium fluviale]|uniref:non-specific protein-tyrosine kinase n=1 Tax=Sphingobium fluviale TaxID=2506423 RepID=A0A4Q1KJF9_9SPHN|nr:CpsD/CapB family tyrosine-protein kinase [Sphingobium fluviale]RXR29953.1 polysaccharide biosynthesis tyrosine autokinase [Sphingobium fluviale]
MTQMDMPQREESEAMVEQQLSEQAETVADVTDATPETAEAGPLIIDETGQTVIGRSGFRFSRKIVALSAPNSVQAESFGSLQTHLKAKHIGDGRRSLAICAATPGVGTSYVAVNLAMSFAMAGLNTMLIDANMRSPGLEDYIAPDKAPAGLRQCLGDNEVEFGDVIQADVFPNLSLIYSGGIAPNPQELLASRAMSELLDTCLRDYDVTIVDTPPGHTSADARRIAMAVRYAMLVAKKDSSYVSDVKQLADELTSDRATVIGTFLNDF